MHHFDLMYVKLAVLKKDDVHFGNRIVVKVVKNKMAPPFKKVELDLLFSEGISKELDLFDAALHYVIIAQSGSWFSFDGKKIAQGRDQALTYLKANPDAQIKRGMKNMQKVLLVKLNVIIDFKKDFLI